MLSRCFSALLYVVFRQCWRGSQPTALISPTPIASEMALGPSLEPFHVSIALEAVTWKHFSDNLFFAAPWRRGVMHDIHLPRPPHCLSFRGEKNWSKGSEACKLPCQKKKKKKHFVPTGLLVSNRTRSSLRYRQRIGKAAGQRFLEK